MKSPRATMPRHAVLPTPTAMIARRLRTTLGSICLLAVLAALLTGCATAAPKSAAAKTKLLPNEMLSNCGARLPRRQTRPGGQPQRTGRIIAGAPTHEGQFPWQASLELLHPTLGFLGHWCGGVLIHELWILSAAHCVHNDLFNLPLPPLWTVVLGEHDRLVESGAEQRIPVERIVLHNRYQNFLHDVVLMKLSRPAQMNGDSAVRRICLPFVFSDQDSTHVTTFDQDTPIEGSANAETFAVDDAGGDNADPLEPGLSELPDYMDNFLRSAQNIHRQQEQLLRNITLPSMKELMSTKILSQLRRKQQATLRHQPQQQQLRPRGRARRAAVRRASTRRRNDKLMKVHTAAEKAEYEGLLRQASRPMQPSSLPAGWEGDSNAAGNPTDDHTELPYIDCVATGWGKANLTGDLTDLLLKTSVPLHHNRRCREAYGSFVNIHRGHLCAGKLNGQGGTCVGDSGGPLQCRLTKNGPWILAGITSFGSGCAIEGFPDVYTRTSFYMRWIQETIARD